jgi:GT2 family glycosyltransferase
VNYEVIVVDNGSSDETARDLPRIKGIRVLQNESNLGFGKASNQGAWAAQGRYILFLNNDTEPLPGWLGPLVRILEEESDVGIVGSKLLFPDGTLQHAGVLVGYGMPFPISPYHVHRGGDPALAVRRQDFLVVTAACMLIRTSLCKELGGFDEEFVNGYEDVDLCFKAQDAGFKVAFAPSSRLVHHESKTPGRNDRMDHNCDRLHRKWLARFWELTRDLRGPRSLAPPPPGRVPLSIIVPVLDSLSTIVTTLEALAAQLTSADQLILSDGGSHDATPLFLSLFASEFPDIASVIHGNEGVDRAAKAALWAARLPRAVLVPPGFAPPPNFLELISRRLYLSPKGAQASNAGKGMCVIAGTVPELRKINRLALSMD